MLTRLAASRRASLFCFYLLLATPQPFDCLTRTRRYSGNHRICATSCADVGDPARYQVAALKYKRSLYFTGSQPGGKLPKLGNGPFDLGNGLFFLLLVFQPQHILLSINWHRKTGPAIALINDIRQIKINDYRLLFVPF